LADRFSPPELVLVVLLVKVQVADPAVALPVVQ
jgi:hypothetical protein